jgi:hypothetical protein
MRLKIYRPIKLANALYKIWIIYIVTLATKYTEVRKILIPEKEEF